MNFVVRLIMILASILVLILVILLICNKHSFTDFESNKTIKFHKRHDRMGAITMGMLRIVLPNIEDSTILYDPHTNVGASVRGYTSNSVFEDFMRDLANMKEYDVRIYKKGDKYDVDLGEGPDVHLPFLYKQYSPSRLKELRLDKSVEEGLPNLKALGLQDIPSRFEELGLKDVYYNTYRKRAIKEGWKLPKGPYIAIHQRLGDVIEFQEDTHRHWQKPTNVKTLAKMISMMKSSYPNHFIYVVTSKGDFKFMEKMLKETDRQNDIDDIIGSDAWDYDKDIWIMMNSDILVTSKSTFSMLAGFLHQGSQIYSLPWNHIYSSNIFTEVDRSGWIKIEEVK